MQAKVIVIVQTLSELEWWFLQNKFARQEVCIATSSVEVGYELDRRNIEYIFLWDYIAQSEIECNWARSNDIGENWLEQSGIEYSDISSDVAKLAGRDMVMMFQTAMNSKSFFSNLFRCMGHLDEVIFFDKHGPALLRSGPHPTKEAADAIEVAILKYILEELGICSKNIVVSHAKKKIKRKCIFNCSQAVRRIKEFFLTVPHDFNNTRPTVLIYNSLFSRAEVKELKNAIQSIGCFAVCVSESSLGAHRGSGCSYSFSDVTLTNQYQYIFGNRYLKYFFDAVSSELIYSVNLAKCFGEICEIITPKLVVFGHDAFTRERVLNKQCNSLSIETASIMHAGISHDFAMINYCLGDSKNKIVWNDWHSSLLCRHLPYARSTKFHTVGSLNHLDYNLATCRPKKKAKKKCNILILTANITIGASTPFANPKLHLKSINDLKLQLDNDGYIVIIKSHPSFDFYRIYDSIATECKNFTHRRDGNLEELVEWADVAILINYPTSASLVALLKGCPLVYIDSASYSLNLWKCTLLNGVINHVDPKKGLKSAIRDALSADTSKLQKDCAEILGLNDEPKFKLQKILKELCSSNMENGQSAKPNISSTARLHSEIVVYGATGLYFEFPSLCINEEAIQCYIESLLSNIMTRKIYYLEIYEGAANALISFLNGSVRLKSIFRLFAIYTMLILKKIYHNTIPRLLFASNN